MWMQWCAPASLQDETLIPQLPGLLDADSSHLSLPQELASAFKVHLDKGHLWDDLLVRSYLPGATAFNAWSLKYYCL